MKKLFLGLLIAILSVACELLPTPEEQPDSKLDIEGYWYMTVENHIYTLDIRTGQAILADYCYEDSAWSKVEMTLIYTINYSEIVVQIPGQDVLRANIAVTGDVLSIANDEVAYLFMRYDGLESSLQEAMQEIEENFIEEKPEDVITPDDNIISEGNIAAALGAVYLSMVDAVAEQLNLENIRIEGVDLYGLPRSITPDSQEVSNTWAKWYKVTNEAKIISDNIDQEQYPIYYNEAVVLRAFGYYNLAMLYGVVVEYRSWDDCVIYNADETFDMVEDMLAQSGEVSDEEYRLSTDDIMALRAEVAMYRGAKEYAASLLTDEAEFELSIDMARFPQYYNVFGEAITIYSTAKTELMLKEIANENTAAEWVALDEERYGYWAMLKRTGTACEIVGCEEYELLMPIPQIEIIQNPRLAQNEGY